MTYDFFFADRRNSAGIARTSKSSALPEESADFDEELLLVDCDFSLFSMLKCLQEFRMLNIKFANSHSSHSWQA